MPQLKRANAFWAEMLACEHFVHYEDEEVFMDILTSFVSEALKEDHAFFQFVAGILARATKKGRKVRAFGEMVAVMWSKGFYGAAVRLEDLWHRLCVENSFTLFCAYPAIGFAENGSEAIAHICAAHSKALAA